MGRPKGSKNKSTKTDEAGPGHNSRVTLTDEQEQSLFLQHKKSYVLSLAAKKEAAADHMALGKLIKAELGANGLDDIKTAILLESDGGEEALKGRIERQLRVARWMALPFGQQANFLFEDDRTPLIDRAAAEGKKAGMEGQTRSPPYAASTEAGQAWLSAWSEGQSVLATAGFKQQALDDAFDNALPDQVSH